MLGLGLKLLASYLVGSINGALVIGFFRGIDIRSEGSGNAGATNALRTHGLLFALAVAAIDIGKGLLAVLAIAPAAVVDVAPVDLRWVAALCGIAAVVGHVFPFWFDFRGGKGGATAIGALAALQPIAVLPVLATWLIVLIGSGYVGLATMTAALAMFAFPLFYHAGSVDLAQLFFGLTVTALVIFAHRSNIVRMREGVEHRVTGAMFWRRQQQ